jgi:glycosyltransferase involved in cell wall biosynthesis
MDQTNRINFSIIVPVYNAENFLHRCLDSLITQTHQQIEIILVNDGSQDKSPLICNNYALNDKRIKVIHQNNQGAATARNVGIKTALGDYLVFVDADDFIEPESCEVFYQIILKFPNIQVIGSNIKKINNNKITCLKQKKVDNPLNGYEFLKYQYQSPTYFISNMGKFIYQRKFIIDNSLFFKDKLLCEDAEWVPRVILAAQSIVTTDFVHYNNILITSSASQSPSASPKRAEALKTIYQELDLLYNQVTDIELHAMLMEKLAKSFLTAVVEEMKALKQTAQIDKNFLKKKLFTKNKYIAPATRRKIFLFNLHPRLFYYYHKLLTLFPSIYERKLKKQARN